MKMTTTDPFSDFVRFRVGLSYDPVTNVKTVVRPPPKDWTERNESVYNGESDFGVACGKINNVIVVDLDAHDDSSIAFGWYKTHFGKIGEFDTFATKSCRGGYHLYFKYDPSVRGIKSSDNVDIQTDLSMAFQGRFYPVVTDLPIRELRESELLALSQLKPKTRKSNEVPKTKDDLSLAIRDPGIVALYQDDLVFPKDKGKKVSRCTKMPITTSWNIEETGTGHKLTHDSRFCTVRPDVMHSTDNHSCLFVHTHGKCVIAKCFSHGDAVYNRRDCNVIINTINLVVNQKDNSVLEDMMEELVEASNHGEFKREYSTGVVYRRVKPYAYTKYCTPMEWINDIFASSKNLKSNMSYVKNMLDYMKTLEDIDFPFIKINKELIGFSNGVLNTSTLEFRETSNECARKYIDKPFEFSMDTPLLDKVLDYQFSAEVRDFIYACLGRCFGIRDNFGFMLYLMGGPGCGKSLILDVVTACFDRAFPIGESFEQKYGLSYLHDKELIICDDLPKDIAKFFPQQMFQSMVTLGSLVSAVKNGDAISIQWKAPLLWCGNWFPEYIDKGQVSRRVMVANFEKNVLVNDVDPTLCGRIIDTELPAFIYKSLKFYNKLLEKKDSGIWKICPEYFTLQQHELKVQRNPLFKFLSDNTIYSEGSIKQVEEVSRRFSQWIKRDVRNLDNGTFHQVNEGYVIRKEMLCIHCEKKAGKGCCERGNNKERKCRQCVMNLAWIGECDIDVEL